MPADNKAAQPHRAFHPTMLDDLGDREGVCGPGWPHPFEPERGPDDPLHCEIDSVIEEDVNQEAETHHETLSHLRDAAHRHLHAPTKWDRHRELAAAKATKQDVVVEGGK